MKTPGYLKLYKSGELNRIAIEAKKILVSCRLCPHKCGVNRLEGEKGKCRTGKNATIASYSAHFGEERPLVGSGGSGTIFLGSCNLSCIFCQNYEISHLDGGDGAQVNSDHLAAVMLNLQKQGCHNINFVTPSHVVPQIIAAVAVAADLGLNIPLVYNSSGYDSVETLQLLDGVIDIYMPDFKFWSEQKAKLYTNAPDYPEVARKALKEMHRQVGDLQLNSSGIACHGLLIRHLVMPNNLPNTKEILGFIATLSNNSYVNVMDQYRPCGQAKDFEEINCMLGKDEHKKALQYAEKVGLKRLDERDWSLLRFLKYDKD